MPSRLLRAGVVLAITLSASLGAARPGEAIGIFYVDGTVKDSVSGAPVADACVVFGPAIIACATRTDANGYYKIDANIPDLPGGQWEVNSVKANYTNGHQAFTSDGASGHYVVNLTMTPTTPQAPPPMAGTPSQLVYLPNITKTLGGAEGWQTPFIVQNVGAANTDLEVNFYRFSDGSLVTRRLVSGLKPGTSFADVPNNDADLPGDTQFSVVVRSFGANVVAVVNEHAGSGARAEAGSYTGASQGATSVYLPNIVKRFFGFVTPFIIQNLGSSTTTATASFLSFDGTKTAAISRTIAPGQSQFIDPNAEASLVDGTQYAVTVTASQPLSVVVNTHRDSPDVVQPYMYSMNGLTSGAESVYGPFAVKGVSGVGEGVSSVVVQNLGGAAVTPKLTFTGPSLAPRASWAFDPRYTDGDVAKPLCGEGASTGCLANGEYSFVATATGGSLAAVVNVVGTATASGYTAAARPSAQVYLPNVTRTLGGTMGWTTPISVQSVTATSLTLRWYRFSDGALVTTQSLTLAAGTAQRIDPRSVGALSDDSQYAVVSDGNGATLVAIVDELNFQGGDGAMIYEGFAQ